MRENAAPNSIAFKEVKYQSRKLSYSCHLGPISRRLQCARCLLAISGGELVKVHKAGITGDLDTDESTITALS